MGQHFRQFEVELSQGKRATETKWVYSQRFASEQMSYLESVMNEMMSRMEVDNKMPMTCVLGSYMTRAQL